jgi:hypothetical protein
MLRASVEGSGVAITNGEKLSTVNASVLATGSTTKSDGTFHERTATPWLSVANERRMS